MPPIAPPTPNIYVVYYMIGCYTVFVISSFDIEVDDEGLDPEIELEMEAFIEEIEEHLMMRDFDPDLEYSQQ